MYKDFIIPVLVIRKTEATKTHIDRGLLKFMMVRTYPNITSLHKELLSKESNLVSFKEH